MTIRMNHFWMPLRTIVPNGSLAFICHPVASLQVFGNAVSRREGCRSSARVGASPGFEVLIPSRLLRDRERFGDGVQQLHRCCRQGGKDAQPRVQ